MTRTKPSFPLDQQIELDDDTIVRLQLSGSYTLDWIEGEPTVDAPYHLEFVQRGRMEEEEVNRRIKSHVDQIMMPILFTDPAVVDHLNSAPRPAPAAAARRRFWHR